MKHIHQIAIAIISIFTLLSCSSDSTTYYTLSVIPSPAEGGTVTPSSGEFVKGEEVEITAQANENWVFDKWEGHYKGSNPITTITMDSSMVIAAMFIKQDYPHTIHVEGDGQISQEIVRSKSTNYPHGTTVKLTAEPDHGWFFSRWEGDLEGEENPVEITVDGETEVTAVFERLEFPLTVHVKGEGTVTQQIVPAKTTDYTFETIIQLTATPETGWTFVRWEDDLSGNENPVEIKIDQDKEVTAVFQENPYTLSVVIEGEGEVEQSVLPSKETIYPFGTNVSLEAFPAKDWAFSHWNDDDDHTDNPITVHVDNDVTVKATFYTIPSLTTKEATNVTSEGAVTGGNISDNGGFPITKRGVCYSKSENPGLSDNCTEEGTGTGEFSSTLDNLETENKYFVRAYATNRAGTAYGNQISFTTDLGFSVPGAPIITDVIAGDRELTVQFEAPEDDGGSPITHYAYRLNSVSGDPDVNIGLNSPFTIREGENDGDGHYEIINGEEYTVRLRAVNAAGEGPRTSFDPVVPQSQKIYLAENGVTVVCPDASPLDKGTVRGEEYIVVDRAQLSNYQNENVCTSLITDMSDLFNSTSDISAGDNNLSSWDVSNVTNMSGMFYDSSFNQDISKWDVSNVTDMTEMFRNSSFNNDIGGWEVGSVTDMSGMFSGSSFNKDIGNWDVSNVTDMNEMFSDSPFNQSIGNWNVSNVTNMSGMFSHSSFNQDIGSWNVSNVEDMSNMFSYSSFNHNLNDWNVSNVINMSNMFNNSSFNKDIGSWNVRKVNAMSGMFADSPFNQDISGWDVVTVLNMSDMFAHTTSFNQPIGNWDVGSVTDMSQMFHEAEAFNSGLRNWDVESVTNMSGMFSRSSFNQDIGSWNVNKVEDMSHMFTEGSFNQDIGDWNVSNVTSMGDMFSYNRDFNQDISKWNVSKVTSMNRMFYYAETFNQDLSGWCVTTITSKPDEFDDGADEWEESGRPVWGTCN